MSEQGPLSPGTVYTETVVHSAPEAFLSDAPYQLAIIQLEAGGRVTARIAGERVSVGDAVVFVAYQNQIPFFRKTT